MLLGQARAANVAMDNIHPNSNKYPLLPLVPKPISEADGKTTKKVQFTLKATPADANSPTYKTNMHVLQGDEDIRSILIWHRGVARVVHGLGLNAYVDMVNIVETMIEGTPLTLFQNGLLKAKQARKAERIANEADPAGAT